MTRIIADVHKVFKHLVFVRNPALIKRILSGYYNTIIGGEDVLRSIELAVTYRCQAKCHKCYAANLHQEGKNILSIDQIREIITQAKRLGLIHVNLTGGEPTLRKDLPDIITACGPENIMVSLVTNAYTLTREKMKEFKEAGLNTIQISLDSADAPIHDTLRGLSGCYDAALSAAAWAREFGIVLCFSTVLSSEDTGDEGAMKQLLCLSKREKAFLLICDSAAVGGWEGDETKMLSRKERNRTLSELLRHPNARHHNLYNFRMKQGCPAGVEKIYITAYGDVTPCDLIHDSFGNVLKEDLETIWKRMRTHPLYSQKLFDCVRYLDESYHGAANEI